MSTQVGVGFSENPKSYDAGIEAATAALANTEIKKSDLAILFSTTKQNPSQLLSSVRSVVGPNTRIIGGQGNGVITTNKFGYEGYQVGVAVLTSDSFDVDLFSEGGLPDNDYNVGVALGKQIKTRKTKGKGNLFIFYDLIKGKPTEECRMNINFPPTFLQGMKYSLGTWPRTSGFCLLGDWQFNPSHQFFDDRVQQQSAMALLLTGDVEMDSILVHGLKPASSYYTITKLDENVILEINNKPALKAVVEILGGDSDSMSELFVVLGINRGEKFGDYNPENYLNRLPYRIEPERQGLVTIERDLKEGDQFQLMRYNFSDFAYLQERCETILNKVKHKKPCFALYLDCLQRASAYSDTEREDVEIVQQIIGSKIPLFGIYTGGEIAEVRGDVEFTLFNSIICIFSE